MDCAAGLELPPVLPPGAGAGGVLPPPPLLPQAASTSEALTATAPHFIPRSTRKTIPSPSVD